MDALSTINIRQTPQSEQAAPGQKRNAAGGYTFTVSDDTKIHRFLSIGTEGGTFYATEKEITKANAAVVLANAAGRGSWLVERIVEISTAGRAPRQNPALFALAACSALADEAGRRAAHEAIPVVCRTGTHLFIFTRYCEQLRGWGAGLRRGIGRWFTEKDIDSLAYQMVKYRQREGWSQRDLLRLAHPVIEEPARRALFNWTTTGSVETSRAPGGELREVGATREDLPALVGAFECAQAATTTAEWVELIGAFPLSWEMLPDAAITTPEVWRALVAKGIPQTALIRQLPRLTRLGVLDGETLATVVAQLTNAERLRKGRIHPINVLVALRTYASGRATKGSSTWTPKAKIIDALDAAFYLAYGAIEPAGKRTLLALDISGSMGWAQTGLAITAREASAALALVTMATEPDAACVGFSTNLVELAISPRQRLDDAIRAVSNLAFGGTDCALPMVWAEKTKAKVDTFTIITDNETWAGSIHPHQALTRYRQKMGIDARCVVVGMTATDFSIADPNDPGMLDVAGMDSNVPHLVADFSRGSI